MERLPEISNAMLKARYWYGLLAHAMRDSQALERQIEALLRSSAEQPERPSDADPPDSPIG